MLDANLVKEVHLHLGPISIDLGTKKGRQSWGAILVIIGILILVFINSTPIGNGLFQPLKDLFSTGGILFFVCGALLYNLRD